MRLIDADEFLKREIHRCGCVPLIGSCTSDNEILTTRVNAMPIFDLDKAVGQIKWERDTAIEQLKSYGVQFGEQAEVQRVRHGKIITTIDKWHGMHQRCSECDEELEWKAYPNYCPNCGAKMESE